MVRSQVEDIYALDDAARKNLRIVMRRGHKISGTVLSAGGRPAVKTLIEAVPLDPNAQYKQAFTDEDGRYVLPGLPDGEIAMRVHSFSLEQKARATVTLKGADAEVNLRLEPVVMKNPVALISLLGMQVADVTPELKAAYDLREETQGVVIVNPGENHERLGIGELEEGEYFWMTGNKQIANLREMVDEILRINELEKPDGWIAEGYRGYIRVVYSNLHGSSTQYMKLTPEDAESLRKLAAQLKATASK